jgi:hypothetical protein
MFPVQKNVFGKKSILTISVLFSLFTVAMGYYYSPASPKSELLETQQLSFPKGSTFEKEWKIIDSLTNLGLTQSALNSLEGIYIKAKSENNAPQIVKAVIHRIKLESFMEEYSLQKSIDKLNNEIKKSKYPLRPVLHSVLAELYWSYYETNRWKFQNRTQTVNFKLDDISTWDIKTIVDQTLKQYQMSLESVDSLKQTPLGVYDKVIINEVATENETSINTRKLRPTLYDFLAQRAVDFYINEEPDIIKPIYKFELSSENYFSKYDNFSKLKIENKDSLSLKFYGLKLLQDLIVFHENSNTDSEALIDVDLKRLKFVRSKSTVEGKDSLYLQALENIEKQFIQSPASTEISYEIALVHNEKANKYKSLVSDEYKWEKKTALSICETAITRFPDSFGATNCKSLQATIKEKSLAFNVEESNSPNKPFRALVQFKNVNKIYLRIIKQDPDKFGKEIENYYDERLINKFLEAAVVKEWTINLPDDGDYQSHSVETKIDGLPLGYYVVLAGTDKGFSYEKNGVAYGSFFITEMTYVQRRAGNGSYDFIVMNRESGHPIKGVSAQLWYQKYDYNSRKHEYIKGDTFLTDENGSFNVSTSSEEYRNYFMAFSKGNDKLLTENAFYLSKYNKVENKMDLKTFFFTDRAIYRPGQTVYFKGIILETDGETNKIKPNEKIKVKLNDVNYQEVATLNSISNEYGTYNGTFTLPLNLINGEMHITDGHGTIFFAVEDYKRPRFEVKFNPIKGVYKLGENVIALGKAQSYAGANLGGAEVKYRVVRTATFPYFWCWWRGYCPSSPQMEITNGITTTNDTGGFVINFNAIPDLSIKKSYSPLYNFTIYADVTDITGETHSNQSYTSVGYNAMKLDVNIGEYLNKDSTQKFNITSTNLNGEPEPAKVKIEIWKQKEPNRVLRKRLWEQADKYLITKEQYVSFFPNDVYADEDNNLKWEKEIKVFSGEFDTQKSKELLLSAISQWKDGSYTMEAVTKDKFGEEVKDVKFFNLYSSKGNTISKNCYDWFVTLKDKGEPGVKASFIIGTKSPSTKILFEVEHKNEIVKKEWLTLNNEQKKIEIPLEEKHRGNFGYHILFVKNGRVYAHDGAITVPYTNKELDIQFETFRNKLPPGQKEEWKVKIKDKKGDKMASEMLAAMYDASLDAFRPNNWYFNIYNNYYSSLVWEINAVAQNNSSAIFSKEWNTYHPLSNKYYERLNWFGYYIGTGYYSHSRNYKGGMEAMAPAPMMKSSRETLVTEDHILAASDSPKINSLSGALAQLPNKSEEKRESEKPLSQISARSNLSETAFFFPQLETDVNGDVIIKFTMPEALTRWKMLGFAHTKDLKFGQIEKEVTTQKELMITPNAPRFFREGDRITFTAKVDNLSSADMNGTAQLFLFDAVTMKEVVGCFSPSGGNRAEERRLGAELEGGGLRNFSAKKSQSAPLEWQLTIPEGIATILYKVVAKAENFTDGEESAVPVLTNRMLVTESLSLPIRGKQTKTFKFEKLLSQNNNSTTLRNHKLTLEFSSNPAWYAVQALPYMMESTYDCSEQIFSRFYANSIAAHIANSSPKIKAVFDSWKSSSPEAFLSNLEKNQELKSLMLEETPWVLDAKDESERKKRIALLFDFNKMANELDGSLKKLQKAQASNGAWPWFEGMPNDRYITQHIVTGIGHLDHLGIKNIRENSMTWNMMSNAVRYLDDRIREDYEWLVKNENLHINEDHISYNQIQYLYARSYFKDIVIESKNQKAFDYYQGQAQKYWLGKGRYMDGMIALGLFRYGDKKTPADIMKSLKENALNSEEMGMYWKENYDGFYWYEAPIECQSLLIEAFDEVANDKKAVDDLRVWLLKSKQTQNWKSTKATTEAVYALLLRGTDWLTTESNVEISLGDLKIDPKQILDSKVEAGTGYFKTSWTGSDIKPKMGNITVNKKDEGVSWGSVYWQYFEQLDKITTHKTPLQLVKKLFIERNTASGPVIEPVSEKTILKPGTKLKVRIELRVDRDMEYAHMKDMRASGFEPVNVFSTYKYQDGLSYYESTRDASTNFFFAYLPKGTYVFEYPLLVSHQGDFSNGITSIQCMYASEFVSHSEGIRVKIEK